jgi:ABC-2 type transport system ATP-binding protein
MNPIGALDGVDLMLGSTAVLRGAELALAPGQLTLLLGRNGAGKSTVLRLLSGQLRPDRGTVRVLGRDPAREAAVRARIGFVPSQPDLPPWMSLEDAARFEGRLRPRWSAARLDRLASALSVPRDRPVSKLSKGQAAGAQLALAFAAEPDLFLLDEPFSGLDVVARDALLAAFLGELELEGRCGVLTTHDLDLAARVADRVVLLWDGRIHTAEELDGTEPDVAALRGLVSGEGQVAA